MAKFHSDPVENTDAEETVFFQVPQDGKPTDQYDTQQLSARQIQQQAARQQQAERYGGYGGEPGGYPRSDRPSGYGQGGYPPTGRAGSGQTPAGGYPQRTGYPGQRPQQRQGRPPVQGRPQSGRPVPRPGDPARRPGGAPPQRRVQPGYGQPGRSRAPEYDTSQPRRRPASNEYAYDTPERPSGRDTRKKPRKKRSVLFRVIQVICILVVGLFLLYSGIALWGIFSMNRVSTGQRLYTSGSLDASYVKNVLVIGTDARDLEVERGRSDSIILVSINSKTNTCYMTSLMRDSYVEIPGNGSGKLNAAYSYGGAELLMDTIEYNFDVRIDDYVLFTFVACADAIDAVGGVELELSDEEARAVNEILISEVNEIMGDDREDDLLSGGGKLKLNGKQALSYSRIRYVGNADFERTQRQRVVMQQVMEKAMGNPFRLGSLCMRALPEMTTNMSAWTLYGYALVTPVQLIFYDLQQQRLPDDTMYQGANIGGESVLQVDFEAARELLEETVYAS